MERILVRVVSYRDTELPRTLSAALETASQADRVQFAVVNQYGPETQGILDNTSNDPRFTVLNTPAARAQGLGWARQLTDSMWRGQEFTLQIDAHTRFDQGWDEQLIHEWSTHNNPQAVLSCYPGEYRNLSTQHMELISALPHKILTVGEDQYGIPQQDAGPVVPGGSPGLLISGGFQFSSGRVCQQVPQAAKVMYGDEFVHALRLFTWGWDVFVPSEIPLYHLYAKDRQDEAISFLDDLSASPEGAARLAQLRRASAVAAQAILFRAPGAMIGQARTRADFYERCDRVGGRPSLAHDFRN